MNHIITPIVPDGHTGFDQYSQLLTRQHMRPDDDGNPQYKMWIIADVRSKVCPVCNKGWDNTSESLQDQATSQMWEGARFHATCLSNVTQFNERRMWYNMFCRVTQQRWDWNEIPRQYVNPAHGAQPWYSVTFSKIPQFVFEVGSRKRVYVIQTMGTICDAAVKELQHLFATEEVTKTITNDEIMVHAWDDDNAYRYFRYIYDTLLNHHGE